MNTDENIQISYHNVPVDENFKNNLMTILVRIADDCPSDSFIKAILSENRGAYICELEVHHTFGHLTAMGEDTSLGEAVDEAVKSLFNQIGQWRHNRYKASNFVSEPKH